VESLRIIIEFLTNNIGRIEELKNPKNNFLKKFQFINRGLDKPKTFFSILERNLKAAIYLKKEFQEMESFWNKRKDLFIINDPAKSEWLNFEKSWSKLSLKEDERLVEILKEVPEDEKEKNFWEDNFEFLKTIPVGHQSGELTKIADGVVLSSQYNYS